LRWRVDLRFPESLLLGFSAIQTEQNEVHLVVREGEIELVLSLFQAIGIPRGQCGNNRVGKFQVPSQLVYRYSFSGSRFSDSFPSGDSTTRRKKFNWSVS